MPAVSIIIVTWNSRAVLPRCLASLTDSAHEVVVIDNDSRDGSADLATQHLPRARVVRQARNLGFAGAVNEAARHASGDFLLLLNSDAEATPGSIDRLARFLDSDDRCAAVAGQLVDHAGTPQRGWNVRRLPTLASFAVDLLLVDRLWPANPVSRRYLAVDLAPAGPAEVEQPAAACLMVRRRAFEQLGGMDERFYPAWFEDVDLCRRLRDAGWRIYWLPDAVFLHQGGQAMQALGLRAFSRIWYRNLERYVAKHHGRVARVTVKALICAGMIERIIVSALRGDASALAAYGGVLRGTVTGWRR